MLTNTAIILMAWIHNYCTTKGNFEHEKNTEHISARNCAVDFPGDAVVKNPPANAGHTGSSPGPGRSHMPWNN